MRVTINNKSTSTEPPPKNRQQPKPPGGLSAFYWYQIFALDSAVVEVQRKFVSHGGLKLMYWVRDGEKLQNLGLNCLKLDREVALNIPFGPVFQVLLK